MLLIPALPLVYGLQITEIMYDCQGTDSGYEWIEFYNDGEEVDLCTYRLYEAETNHYIKGEDCTLASGEYAILADKPDNLNFDKMLDSAFSLSNTGEELCVRDAEKTDLDCVTYSSAQGAAGDGNSLQLIGGEWLAGEPTPGYENAEQEEDNEEQDDEEKEAEEQDDEEEEQDDEEQDRESALEQQKDEALDLANSYQKQPEVKQQNNQKNKETEITGAVVYESDAQKSGNVGILMLLAVSITLNAVFLVSSIRRTK